MSTNHPYPKRWRALGVIATAQFLVIMDTSIIGVALPDMQESLGFSPSSLSWVFNAYVIALGGLLLLGGKLSDVLGARRVFAAGFVILTAASLAAGLAPSVGYRDRRPSRTGCRCGTDRTGRADVADAPASAPIHASSGRRWRSTPLPHRPAGRRGCSSAVC